MTDFFTLARHQRAHREFERREVDDELVERCLDAATRAPSAENLQPWEFIVVRDPAKRAALGEIMRAAWRGAAREFSADRLAPALLADVDRGAEGGIAAAPVLIVVCGNTERALAATLPSSVYPAVQNLLLAAGALGLGSAMTTLTAVAGGDRLQSLLDLPDHMKPMAVVPLGWPARLLGPNRRAPVAERAHREKFGNPW
jgi:nitroreductase